MDNQSIEKYFSVSADSEDQVLAYQELRESGRAFAETVNRLVPESPSKADLMGRLFRIVVDSELAIRMDGVKGTPSMLVMH